MHTKNIIKKFSFIIIFTSIIFISQISITQASTNSKKIETLKTNTPKKEINSSTKKVIAKVNSVSIFVETFDKNLDLAINSLKSQKVDVTTDKEKLKKLKDQVLDDLIINELLKQEIKRTNTTATKEEIEKEYQTLIKQEGGLNKFKEKLLKTKITEKILRENISNRLTGKKYLDKNVDFSKIIITDEEMKKFFGDNTKGLEKPPVFEEVKDRIKQKLTSDKKQALIDELIDSLKKKAKIETFEVKN